VAARSGSSFSFFVIANPKKIRAECIFWGKRNFLRKTGAGCKSHFRQNQKDKGRPYHLKKKEEGASSSPHRRILALEMAGGGGEGLTDQSQMQNRVCAIL
jgi:hypothetical protein